MPWERPLQEDWIINKIDDSAINWAKEFAQYLTRDEDRNRRLTTSQLRKFFGKMRQIEADYENLKNQVPLLKPKLAYSVGRDRSSKIKDFFQEIERGLNYLEPGNKSHFKNLVSLVESIVAYHKFYGGE